MMMMMMMIRDELHNLYNKMWGSVSTMNPNKLYLYTETFSPCQKCQNHEFQCHMSSALFLHLDAQLRLSPQNKLCFWMRKSSQYNWSCWGAWDVILIEHYSEVFPSDLRSGTSNQSSNQWFNHCWCSHTQNLYICFLLASNFVLFPVRTSALPQRWIN